MDIRDQYLDIQLWDSHLIYSVVISGYLVVITRKFISVYSDISDITAEW